MSNVLHKTLPTYRASGFLLTPIINAKIVKIRGGNIVECYRDATQRPAIQEAVLPVHNIASRSRGL